MEGKRPLFIGVAVLVLLAVGAVVILMLLRQPSAIERKAAPFSTHEGMLAINITARRLSSPSIDGIAWLEQGRVSSSVPGDGVIKLLDVQRNELFALQFAVAYAETGSTNPRDKVLMTFVLPYSPEAALVRVETPQGSAEQKVQVVPRPGGAAKP